MSSETKTVMTSTGPIPLGVWKSSKLKLILITISLFFFAIVASLILIVPRLVILILAKLFSPIHRYMIKLTRRYK